MCVYVVVPCMNTSTCMERYNSVHFGSVRSDWHQSAGWELEREMSSPGMCSFIGSIVNCSSFAFLSVSTIRNRNAHLSWIPGVAQSTTCFQSCGRNPRPWRRVTLLLDSCCAFIEIRFPSFFKVPKRVSRFNKCLFNHLSILGRFLVLSDGMTHPERGFCLPVFALELSCDNHGCCSFSFLSSLFGGTSV